MECGANLVGEHGRTLTGYSRQWAGGQFDDFVISQKGLRIYLNEYGLIIERIKYMAKPDFKHKKCASYIMY